MKIRIVKTVAPVKINNHWVYRVDDTIEIETSDLVKYIRDNFKGPQNMFNEKEIVNIIEGFLVYKLERKDARD